MGFFSGLSSDAIVFFDDQNRITKEMIYAEFEAILDHVVGISEFKSQTMRAAFVRINRSLNVKAVVFFLIDFDASGYVDPKWNLPLDHLAEAAGCGPDMGAGPIKLSCRSQCSVSWHQRSLWDPIVETENNTLRLLAMAIKRNRLGFEFDEPDESLTEPPVLSDKHDATNIQKIEGVEQKLLTEKFKERAGAMVEEHKLRIASLKTEAQGHIENLHAQYRAELKKINETVETTRQLFSEEKYKNQQLKETMENQAREFKQVRKRSHADAEKTKNIGEQQLAELREKYELEYKASIDSATADLKERLEMRDVELFYREEQMGGLREELSILRQEKLDLVNGSSDKVLQKLTDSGVTFVAYQPGVDSFSIPVSDIAGYLESPEKYMADICHVDQDLYGKWLTHYELPVCNDIHDDGSVCGRPIAKTTKPSRFIPGESDRCSQHGVLGTKVANVIKIRETH
jgi:hypothetical protein